MRKVFDNRQVTHVWASQSQAEGRSNNGQLYFRHGVIYSYGNHFPIAAFVTDVYGNQRVLYNAATYSATTSKHQGYVRGAMTSGQWRDTLVVYNTGLMRDLLSVLKRDTPNYGHAYEAIKAHYLPAIAMATSELEKARKGKSTDKRRAALLALIENATILCNAVGAPSEDFAPERVAEWRAEEERARLAKAEEARKQQEAFDALCDKATPIYIERFIKPWQDGYEMPSWADVDRGLSEYSWNVFDAIRQRVPTAIRKEGQEAVTTRGARVPWDEAVRLYVSACRWRNSRNGLTLRKAHPMHFTEGQEPRVGHFRLTKIEANGDCHVGCHFLTFEEMHRLAQREGVTLANV